jgi:hypothetical protein
MSDESEINIFKCLDYLRDNAESYAKSKAARVYLEEWRKSHKAILMQEAEKAGQKTGAMMERDAYASPAYQETLQALMDAVVAEESMRWKMIACQAKIETWRTISANQRAEAKNL